MEKIIENISLIEKKAREIIENANNTCDELSLSYDKEKSEYLSNLKKETESCIKKIKEESEKKDEIEIDNLEKIYQNYTKKLESNFNKNKDAYVTAAFKEILKY